MFLGKGVLKICSKFTEKHMPKYDFSKVALQLSWNHTSASVFSSKLAAYFQNTFFWEHIWTAASDNYYHHVWF